MKTLKTILTAFLLLQTVVSFGQTKEETIEWLKEKIKKHAVGSEESSTRVEIITVSPCEISYKEVYKDGNYHHEQFDPSSSVWEGKTGSGLLRAKAGAVIKATNTSWNNRIVYISEKAIHLNGVPDIAERFAKALNHLATFCQNKKETF